MKNYKIEKKFKANGLDCAVVLTNMGHRCGYVAVTKDHKCFGADYDDLNDYGIDVHGGLTYAGGFPDYEDDDLWAFGFDCAHIDDAPDIDAAMDELDLSSIELMCLTMTSGTGTVRSQEYVEGECRKLAKQLATFEN